MFFNGRVCWCLLLQISWADQHLFGEDIDIVDLVFVVLHDYLLEHYKQKKTSQLFKDLGMRSYSVSNTLFRSYIVHALT